MMFLSYALNPSTIIKKQCRSWICTAFLITLRPEVLTDNQRTHGSIVPVSAAYLPIFFSCPAHTYHRQPGCSEAHRPHRSVTNYWIFEGISAALAKQHQHFSWIITSFFTYHPFAVFILQHNFISMPSIGISGAVLSCNQKLPPKYYNYDLFYYKV